MRVWRNAKAIGSVEGGDTVILIASVLLHDCVAVEKDSPLRPRASRLAAERAGTILGECGWQSAAIEAVAHAIEAHSFSANVTARTLEAKIVQDADRLDAIGMIGVARSFYVAGRLGRSPYDTADPRCLHRTPDDTMFAVDHFFTKLLKLACGFQTQTGMSLAQERHRRLVRFLDEFLEEI